MTLWIRKWWITGPKLRLVSGTPLRILLFKQARLITLWIFSIIFIAFYTTKFVLENRFDPDLKDSQEAFLKCLEGEHPSDCLIMIPGVSFPLFMVIRIVILSLPIVVFFVFGARPSLLHFWKEYFTASIRQRRIFLEFIPSLDPTFSAKSSVQSQVTSVEEPEAKLSREKSRIGRQFKKIIDQMWANSEVKMTKKRPAFSDKYIGHKVAVERMEWPRES